MALLKHIRVFANDESGQDLLEYALLVSLIALIALGAVKLAGENVNSIFGNIVGQLGGA
jgi:pilus assembly protein Flp/PilA